MKGKVCVVTGASSGIGFITARELSKKGATVVAVCRDQGRGEAAVRSIREATGASESDVSLMLCDLSEQRSIRAFAAEFRKKYQSLHVLVNNAGAIFSERRLTVDGLEQTFAVNHLGYFLLTTLLLDVIEESAPARIVNVASTAHRRGHLDFDDLQSEKSFSAMGAYGTSKLANIAFTTELSRRLEGKGVTVNCLHPGVVATQFGTSGGPLLRLGWAIIRPFLIDADKGAETSVYLASSPEVSSVTGKYFAKCREARTTREARDPSVAKRLWEESEKLVARSVEG